MITKLGSSTTIQGVEKLLNEYYYLKSYQLVKDQVYNKDGLCPHIQVNKRRGRYYIEVQPKTEPAKTGTEGLIENILSLLRKHVDTTKAILDDYMLGDDDCRMELSVAQDNLKDEISEMEVEYSYPKLLEMVKDHEDYNSDDILQMLIKEEGEIVLHEALQGRGYAIIKVDNILDQEKLRTFVETALYPMYSDCDKFSI